MNLPGCFSDSAPLRSVVLNPSVYHSLRYVGWNTATSTYPSSNTSFMRSSSEYFWKCSSDQWVSGGPRLW